MGGSYRPYTSLVGDYLLVKKKLIEITWRDIVEEAGWVDDKDHEEIHILKTYGLLISKTKNTVTIANTYDPELKMWGGRNKFPRGCISNIRVVEIVDL